MNTFTLSLPTKYECELTGRAWQATAQREQIENPTRLFRWACTKAEE